MERFDEKGMLIIPNPIVKKTAEREKVLVVVECFCQNGHNLVSPRAVFNGHPGIIIRVKKDRKRGLIALSPVYGEKARIALDIDLVSGEVLDLHCPACDARLLKHSPCICGADMIALFTTPAANFSDCIGVCNRIDCPQAKIINSGELIALSMVESL